MTTHVSPPDADRAQRAARVEARLASQLGERLTRNTALREQHGRGEGLSICSYC